jgi:hypothetical protein
MPDAGGRGKPIVRQMTVAEIRDAPPAGGDVMVAFNESARFYRVPDSHPRFAEILHALRHALKTSRPVEVKLASHQSDVIEAAGSTQ